MSLPTKYPVSIPEYVGPASMNDLIKKELFHGVNRGGLKSLLGHSNICRLGAGKNLLPTRDGKDYLYIINSGYVAIWLASSLIHNGENFLAWRGPEQIIGEMRSIGDEPTEARITTCEPCEFIEICSDALTDLAEVTPRIYRNVARLLMEKLHQERHRAEVIQMSTARQQVAQTLLYLAEERRRGSPPDKSNVFTIPGLIHQDEIGAYIGAERETTNRVLCKLRGDKTITYTSGRHGCEITILDRSALNNIVRKPSARRARKRRMR